MRKPKKAKRAEKEIKQDVADFCRGGGVELFNNCVGAARNPNGQWVSYGLGPGSADKIGYKTITITPEMVGKRMAIFLAVETKTEDGKLEDHQRKWLLDIIQAGGIAFVCRRFESAVSILRGSGWRRFYFPEENHRD